MKLTTPAVRPGSCGKTLSAQVGSQTAQRPAVWRVAEGRQNSPALHQPACLGNTGHTVPRCFIQMRLGRKTVLGVHKPQRRLWMERNLQDSNDFHLAKFQLAWCVLTQTIFLPFGPCKVQSSVDRARNLTRCCRAANLTECQDARAIYSSFRVIGEITLFQQQPCEMAQMKSFWKESSPAPKTSNKVKISTHFLYHRSHLHKHCIDCRITSFSLPHKNTAFSSDSPLESGPSLSMKLLPVRNNTVFMQLFTWRYT